MAIAYTCYLWVVHCVLNKFPQMFLASSRSVQFGIFVNNMTTTSTITQSL